MTQDELAQAVKRGVLMAIDAFWREFAHRSVDLSKEDAIVKGMETQVLEAENKIPPRE